MEVALRSKQQNRAYARPRQPNGVVRRSLPWAWVCLPIAGETPPGFRGEAALGIGRPSDLMQFSLFQ